MAASHSLESQAQVSSAGFKHTEAWQLLTSWRVRSDIVSWLDMHQGTAATHSLECRGQVSSAGLEHTKAWQPLTAWRARSDIVSWLEMH
jgi:hypothetical protein